MPAISSAPFSIAVVPNTVPAWVPPPGQYASVSLHNPSGVDPDPTNSAVYWGNAGFDSIWSAYNGGAYAPTLGAMGSMLFFGGGHYAYEGNCVVRYDIASRDWELFTLPTLTGTRHTTGNMSQTSLDSDSVNDRVGMAGQFIKLGDESPIAGTDVSGAATTTWLPYPIHTNCGLAFLPPDAGGGALGSLVFVGHDNTGINVVSANGKMWRLDLATKIWSVVPYAFNQWYSVHACEYDAKNKVMWAFAGGSDKAQAYSWLDDSWTVLSDMASVNNTSGVSNACFMPDRDLLVLVRRDAAQVYEAIDVSGYAHGVSSSLPYFQLNVTGNGPLWLWGGEVPTGGQNDRLEYSSYDGCLWFVERASPTSPTITLFKLTPPPRGQEATGTWVWTNETLTAQAGDPRGTMACAGENRQPAWGGRCRYIPALKSFLISDGRDLPVQALRPAAYV